MYIQVRADTIDERMLTTPDEALSLAALALQCELGDYKAVKATSALKLNLICLIKL